MTALELRQDAEAEFARDARRAREELAQALAMLTEQANIMLEAALRAEHEAQSVDGVDYASRRASVSLITAARSETKRTMERVARACGVQ